MLVWSAGVCTYTQPSARIEAIKVTKMQHNQVRGLFWWTISEGMIELEILDIEADLPSLSQDELRLSESSATPWRI